jgi:hypothetical protein
VDIASRLGPSQLWQLLSFTVCCRTCHLMRYRCCRCCWFCLLSLALGSGNHCLECGEEEGEDAHLLRCAGCKMAYYCSKACQKVSARRAAASIRCDSASSPYATQQPCHDIIDAD